MRNKLPARFWMLRDDQLIGRGGLILLHQHTGRFARNFPWLDVRYVILTVIYPPAMDSVRLSGAVNSPIPGSRSLMRGVSSEGIAAQRNYTCSTYDVLSDLTDSESFYEPNGSRWPSDLHQDQESIEPCRMLECVSASLAS